MKIKQLQQCSCFFHMCCFRGLLLFLAFELNRELNQKTTWQQVLASCVTNQKCLQTERIR